MRVNETLTFAEYALRFYAGLARKQLQVPPGFKILNPFTKEQIMQVTRAFYEKYYHDTHKRRMILGSSPARLGSAQTGIPFEDGNFLETITGFPLEKRHGNRSSSDFMENVKRKYGGRAAFYATFYMNFVCPLGVAGVTAAGREVNCNYYENKTLRYTLRPFMVDALREQMEFGIDVSVCYCIGSGENYQFLSQLNAEYGFFRRIVPLPHPRFIMQYHAKQKDEFLKYYLDTLCAK